MAIYEIDTLKQSLKKYAVILAIGVGIGIYVSSCTKSSTKDNAQSRHYEYTEPGNVSQIYHSRQERLQSRTPQEERLRVFESYTRAQPR